MQDELGQRKRMFQFLIGSLKTQLSKYKFELYFQFQFLIGSLKTALHIAVYFDFSSVSIPYR